MNDRELTRILSTCLEEIAAGDTLAACLARYPEQAGALAPMLAAAVELQALRSHDLSVPARLRAKARLREAQARQRSISITAWSARVVPPGWWPRLGALPAPRALAGVLVALCLLVLSAGIVAASHPGDLAYGLRVAVERVPARLVASPEARARAELAAADRRLEDLQRSLGRAQGADSRAIDALLAGEEAAARMAASLSPSMQAQIAAHIEDQGRRLELLSLAALQEETANSLHAAATRAYQAARTAHPGVMSPAETPLPPLPGKAEIPRSGPEATSTRVSAPAVTPSLTSADATQPTAPLGRVEPTRQPSVSKPTEGQGEREPPPTGTPGSAERHGSEATPAGAGPTPRTLSSGPAPTSPGPGPASTAPGPGPASTSPGSGPESPAAGPGSEPNPAGPGPGRG